ncbi:EF-hand domain-containing protein, partial [Haematococcus lacustris]
FIEGFQRLDGSKLGTFTFDELCAYMGVKPSEADDEDGSGSDSEGLEEEEGAGIAGWGSRSATPVQAGV